jgi:hypothetical protein
MNKIKKAAGCTAAIWFPMMSRTIFQQEVITADKKD